MTEVCKIKSYFKWYHADIYLLISEFYFYNKAVDIDVKA